MLLSEQKIIQLNCTKFLIISRISRVGSKTHTITKNYDIKIKITKNYKKQSCLSLLKGVLFFVLVFGCFGFKSKKKAY